MRVLHCLLVCFLDCLWFLSFFDSLTDCVVCLSCQLPYRSLEPGASLFNTLMTSTHANLLPNFYTDQQSCLGMTIERSGASSECNYISERHIFALGRANLDTTYKGFCGFKCFPRTTNVLNPADPVVPMLAICFVRAI